MPIKRPHLVNREIYHIVIRTIEGFKLFIDNKDYFRMIHDLFEFNDQNPVSSNYRHISVNSNMPRSVLGILNRRKKRELLVEILAFCLMPNHVHLLVRQIQDGGISKFMRKIGAGYGNYYNKKYKRNGHLFQGRFRVVHVKNDKQLMTVFVYIHTNPVAIIVPNWKEKGINNVEKAIQFLENYRWSSYLDYLQKQNFPSLTSRGFLTEVMGGIENCRKFVEDWLCFKKELADFDKIAIE
ncbi:MAG: hypothetical protein FJZ07_02380 [Candidatus Nealsonbacteria bacterium]|nr:hypothetical protein [Candidatus Nealsonbacteria bacterium]